MFSHWVPIPTLEIIAKNLRQGRNRLGLSQEELADRAGLHRTYVGAVERAQKNLTIGSLERLAGAIDSTVTKMVSDNGL